MLTGFVITLIGMLTVFFLLALMIAAVKLLSIIFSESKRGKKQSREEREIAIALAALKNVLG